jgi:hypothetical protein
VLTLPGHIVKKSERWYLNTKTNRFISVDYIEAWAENYWKYHSSESVSVRVKYEKNVKLARKRWDL